MMRVLQDETGITTARRCLFMAIQTEGSIAWPVSGATAKPDGRPSGPGLLQGCHDGNSHPIHLYKP